MNYAFIGWVWQTKVSMDSCLLQSTDLCVEATLKDINMTLFMLFQIHFYGISGRTPDR